MEHTFVVVAILKAEAVVFGAWHEGTPESPTHPTCGKPWDIHLMLEAATAKPLLESFSINMIEIV